MAAYPITLDLTRSQTGDPVQREKAPPANANDADARRVTRQAIMSQLMREVADEIVGTNDLKVSYIEQGIQGNLMEFYNRGDLPKLRELIETPEAAFNRVRDQLGVPQDFGSINLVVFRNAMAIGVGNANPVEEVAIRVVIRAGISGNHRDRGFAGCK